MYSNNSKWYNYFKLYMRYNLKSQVRVSVITIVGLNIGKINPGWILPNKYGKMLNDNLFKSFFGDKKRVTMQKRIAGVAMELLYEESSYQQTVYSVVDYLNFLKLYIWISWPMKWIKFLESMIVDWYIQLYMR